MFKPMLVLAALSLPLAACEQAPTAPAHTSADEAAAVVRVSAALVRTEFPSADDPGPPFYARIEPLPFNLIVVDDWAVVYFYRDPTCIPPAFNLRAFFDAPLAFACTALVEGQSLWQGEAFLGAPKIVQTQGMGAVPFWFIPADAMVAAVQDEVLTIGELAGLDGRLIGTATRFHEVLHPHPVPPISGGGGHPNPKLIVSAHGTLEDGRSFQFDFVRQDRDVRSVRLRFR